ncbi:hypothetical protein EJ08DRAFT_653017 [Tothia fuscella]|uniref:Extracellular membrane protein CFEM domain-containing protein n=1 Tax=Tothia fuscella TaxID=1048955 RepID=A0A9P4NIE5_9PEZI|nr:hypothetical protein EJ08DRAFT_653017 [Tothia fuscella]
MRLRALVIFIEVLRLAAAQDFANNVPACSVPCLTTAIKDATTCAASDGACIWTFSTYHVMEKCGPDIAVDQVIPAAQKFCGDVISRGDSNSSTISKTATRSTTSATNSIGRQRTEVI